MIGIIALDVLLLELFSLFANAVFTFLSNKLPDWIESYGTDLIFVVVTFLLAFYAWRSKLKKEIKAIAIAPFLQGIFIIITFIAALVVYLVQRWAGDNALTTILFWILNFVAPTLIVFFMIRSKKSWIYIFTVIFAFLSLYLSGAM